MTKLINLGNCSYVNLKNAATFSLGEDFTLVEEKVKKRFLFVTYEDWEIVKKKTLYFEVNGEKVYETLADDEKGKAKISQINSAITGFIRKRGED